MVRLKGSDGWRDGKRRVLGSGVIYLSVLLRFHSIAFG